MAEGGRLPWSSRRRQARRRRRWNDSESSDNEESEIDRDLLRVVLSDSEDFVPDDVKNTSSVACSCDTDLEDEQPGGTELSSVKNCPNLSDLDPEVRRRSQSFRWLAKKVTRRKNEKDLRKKSSSVNRRSDRDENGLGYYARRLQEAKRVREKAELEARNKRMGLTRRRRPLSMISFRAGNCDEESENARRRRFSLTWGFRRGTGDTNLEEATSDVVAEGENFSPGEQPPSSSSQAPREYGRGNAISLEELQRRRREKARLKAAQHKLEYFLINDIVSVTNCPWYWGKINRFQAEKVLEGYPDGTFLLRDSAQYHYLFSVSFRRYSRTYHARIEQWKHKYSFDKPSDYSFYSTSVCQLLQHYSRAEQCMYYEPMLLKPLQRRVPPSLQDHCRAAICSRITFQGVSELPLPNSMKIFLREFHYKVPVKRTQDKGTQTPAPKKRLNSFFHRD